ncbi:MAG: FHA domain-containing protein [Actinomycetes bacterium]|jgi:FOG: FHA domain|nr:FHA domain-containing protein [Acidimicrobiia bacterium]
MPDIILALLRLIFLGLIYLFVWQVARGIATHLGIHAERRRRRGTKVVIVRSDTQAGLDFTVTDATVIGRSPEADIVIDDPYASEFHLRLVATENGLTLHDLGSTNGTYLNGRRVTAPAELRRGDAVQVGKTVMEIR